MSNKQSILMKLALYDIEQNGITAYKAAKKYGLSQLGISRAKQTVQL